MDCQFPTKWSTDFTKLLIAGVPAGKSAIHIAILDISKPIASLIDLTELRQHTGFSDPVLNDTNPSFLADSASDRVTYGSRHIVFQENGTWLSVDTNNPTTAMPADFKGHPEAEFVGDNASSIPEVSPDGRFWYVNDVLDTKIVPATDRSQSISFSCPEMSTFGFFAGNFVGWADVSHVIAADDSHAALIDVTAAGPTCHMLIPATGKTVSGVQLSVDRQTVTFTVAGPNGPEIYSVPVSLAPAKPIPSAPNTDDQQATYFYPGNH